MNVWQLFFCILLHSSFFIDAKIHVFGDSHAYFCFSNKETRCLLDEQSSFCTTQFDDEKCVVFNIHHMGPMTMHRVGRDALNALNIKNVVRAGDVVVFVFGEIDVRCHIEKQKDLTGLSRFEIIENLVKAYISAIKKNVQDYLNLTVVVMVPVPPADFFYDPGFPRYADIKSRIIVNNLLADSLKKACKKHRYHLLDIRSYFSLADGSLNFELSDGIVHIGLKHNRIIKEELFKLIEN